MTTFSERFGLVSPKAVQLQSVDDDLRNSFWNIIEAGFFKTSQDYFVDFDPKLYPIAQRLYGSFHKRIISMIPSSDVSFVDAELEWFQKTKWNKVYEYIEFLYQIANQSLAKAFQEAINNASEKERSGYRMVGGIFVAVTNEHELKEIERGLALTEKYETVTRHIEQALLLYSNREKPDYRNSIKEAISAVEAAAKTISGLPNATLGDAIKVVEKQHPIHGAFREGISKLYGYTNQAGGIRHSLEEAGTEPDEIDARFMLIACSAFTNYLISRVK